MSEKGNAAAVSPEGLRRAADELASCSKRMRYIASDLDSCLERLKKVGGTDSEIIELSRQKSEIEARSRNVEVMSLVLDRISDEAEMAENAVIDHADMIHAEAEEVKMNDLARMSEMISEVMKQYE